MNSRPDPGNRFVEYLGLSRDISFILHLLCVSEARTSILDFTKPKTVCKYEDNNWITVKSYAKIHSNNNKYNTESKIQHTLNNPITIAYSYNALTIIAARYLPKAKASANLLFHVAVFFFSIKQTEFPGRKYRRQWKASHMRLPSTLHTHTHRA